MSGTEANGMRQWYIGATNGVVVCIDRRSGRRITGRMYHRHSVGAIPFFSEEQIVYLMEELFDRLQFPHASTNERSFLEEKKPAIPAIRQENVMKDGELLSKRGDLGTFIIRVRHRQNSSWQGAVTWMEADRTVEFRSVWEMVKLIENAMDSSGAPQKDAPTWET